MAKKEEISGTEKEFLNWYKEEEITKYEKPSLTVDNVILAWDKGLRKVRVLLIKRGQHPFKGKWALPGGFVNADESVTEACLRETKEETGVEIDETQAEQLFTFSQPNRDPRGWTISCAYLSYLPEFPEILPGDDADEAQWFVFDYDENGAVTLWSPDIGRLDQKDIAFDHLDMLEMAHQRLVGRMNYNPTFLNILGTSFILPDVLDVYQSLNGFKSTTTNFVRTHKHVFERIGDYSNGPGRPAGLYRLKGEN